MVMKLTASQENYLELIWRLHQRGPVRVSEIARLADIRLPSVTKAVGKLVAAGMVQHESYGTITFTELGREAAESVARRDVCLSRLLAGLLGMPQEEASENLGGPCGAQVSLYIALPLDQGRPKTSVRGLSQHCQGD